ncbi:TPA: hypothetical protein N0F65_012117, partial [Lagenidium giganteum]
ARWCLGIDIGTTAVKCVVVQHGETQATATATVSYNEEDATSNQRGEQSVMTIVRSIRKAITGLPAEDRHRVTVIGICGQMHGIAWWNAATVVPFLIQQSDDAGNQREPWSRLITWEDQRCSPEFIAACHSKMTPDASRLATGYGVATFAHEIQMGDASALAAFDCSGTIADLVAFVLSGATTPEQATMDTTNAFSWGAYDSQLRSWSQASIEALGLPLVVLPRVVAPRTVVGNVSERVAEWFGLPASIPVLVPMGDHPCSVLATIAVHQQRTAKTDVTIQPNLTLINMGTSAQLAVVLAADDELAHEATSTSSSSFEVRPFLDDQFSLGVAAALSGGNVMAWFVQQCREWMEQLGAPASSCGDVDAMYARVIALGHAKFDTSLQLTPTLLGERSDPSATGAIDALRMHNASIGDLSAALCKGLISNLFHLLPPALALRVRSSRTIATGNALVRNSLLQRALAEALTDPALFDMQQGVEAALGAAIIAGVTNPRQGRPRARTHARTEAMGCCFSKEEDHFDGKEALLPKGKAVEKSVREDHDQVDLSHKVGNGHGAHYKSPDVAANGKKAVTKAEDDNDDDDTLDSAPPSTASSSASLTKSKSKRKKKKGKK